MAERGGQPGNQNATKNKPWAMALEHVAERWPELPDIENCTALARGHRLAAFEFYKNMMAKGDCAFFREFGDRNDGKCAQSVTIAGDDLNPLRIIATATDERL